MQMRCLACGAVKDTSVKELYPYPEDAITDDRPMAPLFVIDCRGVDWRVVIVCHHCVHRLDPDLWISDHCWTALNPITPFHELPFPLKDENTRSTRFDVEAYATNP